LGWVVLEELRLSLLCWIGTFAKSSLVLVVYLRTLLAHPVRKKNPKKYLKVTKIDYYLASCFGSGLFVQLKFLKFGYRRKNKSNRLVDYLAVVKTNNKIILNIQCLILIPGLGNEGSTGRLAAVFVFIDGTPFAPFGLEGAGLTLVTGLENLGAAGCGVPICVSVNFNSRSAKISSKSVILVVVYNTINY
jgi:hypothetical protein